MKSHQTRCIRQSWPLLNVGVTFSNEDIKEVQTPYNDAVVVSIMVAKHDIKRILVDNESFANILIYDAFRRMKLILEKLKVYTSLTGFSGNSVIIEGEILLLVTASQPPR